MSHRITCLAFVAVLFFGSCRKSQESSSPPAADSGSVATVGDPMVGWCSGKAEGQSLARWGKPRADEFVSYCLEVEFSEPDVVRRSVLDIRQENLAEKGHVVWSYHQVEGEGLYKLQLYRGFHPVVAVGTSGDSAFFFGVFVQPQGLEPVRFKLVGHVGEREYQVSGSIPPTEEDSAKFRLDFDPEFKMADPILRNLADSLAAEFVRQICEDKKFGVDLPVPPQVSRRIRPSIAADVPPAASVKGWILRSPKGTCSPGDWVASSPLSNSEMGQASLLGEEPGPQGITVRSFYHHGTACDWITTSRGGKTMDGPYWILQVQSQEEGACVDTFCVGHAFAGGSEGSKEILKGDQGLTVDYAKGRISKLTLVADHPIGTHP